MIFAERIPAFQQLLPHDAQRMLNIDPRQVVVAFAQAVVGGVDLPPEEMPPSLYFPVNNRKKTGGRVQPGADTFCFDRVALRCRIRRGLNRTRPPQSDS